MLKQEVNIQPRPGLSTCLQVADGLVVAPSLQVTLAHEEMSFDRLTVQLQSVSAVAQRSVVLLQLHGAQSSVGVERRDRGAVGLGVGGGGGGTGHTTVCQTQPSSVHGTFKIWKSCMELGIILIKL